MNSEFDCECWLLIIGNTKLSLFSIKMHLGQNLGTGTGFEGARKKTPFKQTNGPIDFFFHPTHAQKLSRFRDLLRRHSAQLLSPLCSNHDSPSQLTQHHHYTLTQGYLAMACQSSCGVQAACCLGVCGRLHSEP